MDVQTHEVIPTNPRVKVTLRLESEKYSVNRNGGSISEQLLSVKEETMNILKDFITKHNVPNDVPDELVDSSSEDEEAQEKPHAKSKKTKLT
ncbi:uncharacterized protein LOC110819505 [Carica papaya]|uniref:uncharacterized protein LOC110819505 n=1 Tax=Carica papaya TaxID=3649 RepID=UPI000B8C8911|nr:uncharacterized protein LOC110819505 [Carica papaya]